MIVGIDSTEALAATLRLTEHKLATVRQIGAQGVEAALERLGVTREELEHIAIPTFGLNERGERDFDFGPRTIRLRLTDGAIEYEDLSTGKISSRAPKGRASDDMDLVEEAHARLALVHKPLKAVLARHVSSFEEDMLLELGWTGAHWLEHIAWHPLLGPLAWRLVWSVRAPGEETSRFVRPSSDGSLIDLAMDDAPPPEASDLVSIAHPVHLGDALGAWSEHMASFDLAQPFEQLERLVLEWDEDTARMLDRLESGGGQLSRKTLRKLVGPRAGGLDESTHFGSIAVSYWLHGHVRMELSYDDDEDKRSPLRYSKTKLMYDEIAREGTECTWATIPALIRAETLRTLALASSED